MAQANIIAPDSLEELQSKSLGAAPKPLLSLNPFPGYMRLVRDELDAEYQDLDLRNEGYRIFTSLDPLLQDKLETSVSGGVESLERGYFIEEGKLQAAGILTRIGSGQITACLLYTSPSPRD